STIAPRLRLGAGKGPQECRPVEKADGVPRPAKPARETFRRVSASPETPRLRRGASRCPAPRLPHVLPRRLCRPRHGVRKIYRPLHAHFRPRPETESRVGFLPRRPITRLDRRPDRRLRRPVLLAIDVTEHEQEPEHARAQA